MRRPANREISVVSGRANRRCLSPSVLREQGDIMRIIAEKDTFSVWVAWWADEPQFRTHCTSRFGAVDKLLRRSTFQAIAVENLSIDTGLLRGDRVEMLIKKQGWEE
jgi:hypothetical protein